ncbi:MAG: dihydrodipicolinate synthase family protein, partial [Pirellulales bacterium]
MSPVAEPATDSHITWQPPPHLGFDCKVCFPMAFQELSQPLRGIIPPVVTPLAGPDQLDEAALERLVDYLVAGGVHGLF